MVRIDNERFFKSQRLRKRRQYLEVQSLGYRVTSRLFIGLVLMRGPRAISRLGITITRKYAGAVIRNKTRRLIKEAFRKKKLMVPQGIDLVIIPKKQAIFYNNPQIFEDLFLLGSKITRYVESQQ
jgi:ribonuclease P protein component